MSNNPPRRNTWAAVSALAAYTCTAGTLCFSSVAQAAPTLANDDLAARVTQMALQYSVAPVVKKVLPTVVNIHTRMLTLRLPQAAGLENPAQEAVGSGVIVDGEAGIILTNLHVVKEAASLTVTLHDGRLLQAEYLGGDPETDLAVLRVKAKNLQAIAFANSDQIAVGDSVLAIGSPFGLSQTVTSGIVSGLGRSIGMEFYEDFIQTDAPINPGNSGGALVNMHGQLIGINTAIFTPTENTANVGIGFAIPSNMAKNIGEQLVQFGKVRRGLLGVAAQTLTPDLGEAFGASALQGALIDQVFPDSLAEKNKLFAGDIVTHINGRPIRTASEFRNSIGLIQIGEPLKLSLFRNRKKTAVSFTMQDPANTLSIAEQISEHLAGSNLMDGFEAQSVQGAVHGVRILNVHNGSPAWETGLRPGDLILSANQTPVPSVKDFRLTADHTTGNVLLLRILRDNHTFFLALKRQNETA